MLFEFSQPAERKMARVHHGQAAAGNKVVADQAVSVLRGALSKIEPVDRILLKAAAGAGKSHVLQELVVNAIEHPECARVAIVAFTNKQIHPLAAALGKRLGAERVCLFVSEKRIEDVPADVGTHATIVTKTQDIPRESQVVIATSHKLGSFNEVGRLVKALGTGHQGASPFDVLFVDEAWQLPHHLFDKVAKVAPITVGVGDVGQLPPLEIGTNPWRGDSGFNPYRAWPTAFEDDDRTWSAELPAVWRPTAGHLDLWRAFYPDWAKLNCVAAPGDRALVAEGLSGDVAGLWRQVGIGVPTLLEVEGLPDAEAADVDLPLMLVIESLLDGLFASGFALEQARYDSAGLPTGKERRQPGERRAEPLVTVLATRNQAVDDATDVVNKLREKYSLDEGDLVASTVDSWQGQTNGITVAIHPLSGAAELDDFNSAFGRLAVTCTRATHGLLMLSRPGLDRLLGEAPARPGTPFGEPGNRSLPRQTHQRILESFARGRMAASVG